MTDAAYAHMFALAGRIESGLREAIARHGLAWCVTRVGARNEFQFMPAPPRNGSEAGRQLDPELELVLHLYLLNRGVLITPFHNMILVCPDTSVEDVDKLVAAFDACLGELI